MNNNKKLKAFVLSMALSALLALPTTTFAQREKQGGLFGTDPTTKNVPSGGVFNSQGINRDLTPTGDISNYGLGETVPVGSGIVILLGAGLGYVALKKKEDEQ